MRTHKRIQTDRQT